MNQMMWFGISIAISLIISILLPFPLSLVTIIGVFILLSFYMRKRMMRRMGVGGGAGRMFGSGSSMFGDNSRAAEQSTKKLPVLNAVQR
jgi:hypothetical protein